MRELPRAAQIYVLAVIAVGAVVLVHAALRIPAADAQPQEALLFALLTSLADLNRLELTYRASYSVGTAINVAAVIILGTDTAVVVAASAAAVGELAKRNPPYKTGFNVCATLMSVAIGGAAYDALRVSPPGTVAPADVPALLAYTVVNFLVNHALICIVISLATRTRPWYVFVANYRSILIPAVALFPIGVLLAVAYTYFDRFVGIMLLVVPFVAVFVALNRARQLQQQTEELAKRDAEAAALRELDRLKNEFMRTISHELRTPLTLVHGYAELLHTRAAALDDTGKRMIARIYSGSTQLTRLVEDLLDFARIERGELAVQTEDFDVVPVLREVIGNFQGTVPPGRLRLEAPPALPIQADPARMAQVVTNLVENAIKYAPRGPITLRARASSDAARIEVQDEGPGIPPHEQARVWEKFYRGAEVAGRNGTPGSGIGLAVVRALAEAQGGTTGLRSAPNQGSTFWIEVNLAEPEGSLAVAPDEFGVGSYTPRTGAEGRAPAAGVRPASGPVG